MSTCQDNSFDPREYGVHVDILNSLIGMPFKAARYQYAEGEDEPDCDYVECVVVGFRQEGVLIRFKDRAGIDIASFYDLLNNVEDEACKGAIRQFKRAVEQHKRLCDSRDYDIYRLRDPRNNHIRYVGISIKVTLRYIQHTKHHSKNAQKDGWIEELKSEGLLPELEIIERVTGKYYALKREAYWIAFYSQQYPLLNIDQRSSK